jgi:predicted nucleotidyltransferase
MENKLDKQGIVNFLRNNKHILKNTFFVEDITIIGSLATDNFTSESDVDIIYHLIEGKNLNYNLFMQLVNWLENNLGRKVDLICSKNINPIIKLTASRSAQVVI